MPFFDHMLTLFAVTVCLTSTSNAKGDIEVDFHHTVEDVGITHSSGHYQGARRQGGHPTLWILVRPDGRGARSRRHRPDGRPYLAYNPPKAVEAIGGNFFFPAGRGVPSRCLGHGRHESPCRHPRGRDAHHMAEASSRPLPALSMSLHRSIPACRAYRARRVCYSRSVETQKKIGVIDYVAATSAA